MAFHFPHKDCILVLVDFKIIFDELSYQRLLLPEMRGAVLDIWQVSWDDVEMLTSQSKICRLKIIRGSLTAL